MSFAGPAEAAKAIRDAVSSKNRAASIHLAPRQAAQARPAAKVKLPTSSYVAYVLPADLPNFLLVLDPRAARIPQYGQAHPYKASKTYADLKQLLPAWEPTTEYDTGPRRAHLARDQPAVPAGCAQAGERFNGSPRCPCSMNGA